MLKWEPKISLQGVNNVLHDIDYWKNAPLWTPKKILKATKNWFKYLNDFKNILITGASGYVGASLTDKIISNKTLN